MSVLLVVGGRGHRGEPLFKVRRRTDGKVLGTGAQALPSGWRGRKAAGRDFCASMPGAVPRADFSHLSSTAGRACGLTHRRGKGGRKGLRDLTGCHVGEPG